MRPQSEGNWSQVVTGCSGDEIRPLVQALLRVQAHARAHGLFAHDRGLLDCRRCGLSDIEDVQANALYLAKSGANDPHTPPRQAIVCFDSHLETETLEWLRQQKGQRVIVLEAALDTTAKWNLHHQLGDGLVVF